MVDYTKLILKFSAIWTIDVLILQQNGSYRTVGMTVYRYEYETGKYYHVCVLPENEQPYLVVNIGRQRRQVSNGSLLSFYSNAVTPLINNLSPVEDYLYNKGEMLGVIESFDYRPAMTKFLYTEFSELAAINAILG